MKKVLVTDSLFIHDAHIAMLEAAGFQVDRLDKPDASESELIERLQGVSGYILGGVEKVTDAVIASTDQLEAITFTGAGYTEYIPGHEAATARGIAITIAPGVTPAVSEYTIALMLMMTRQLLTLGRTGDQTFGTTPLLTAQRIGIVGLGRNGEDLARRLIGLGAKTISYYSPTRRPALEAELGLTYRELPELFANSDVVSLNASKPAGEHFIGADLLAALPNGALLVNTSFAEAVDPIALHKEIANGRISAAYDAPPSDDFSDLPLGKWFSSNASTAFNTTETITRTSDIATQGMINMLTTGIDEYFVNPQCMTHRS